MRKRRWKQERDDKDCSYPWRFCLFALLARVFFYEIPPEVSQLKRTTRLVVKDTIIACRFRSDMFKLSRLWKKKYAKTIQTPQLPSKKAVDIIVLCHTPLDHTLLQLQHMHTVSQRHIHQLTGRRSDRVK